LAQSGGKAITLSSPSFFAASISPDMFSPPKSAAEVASLALTPEEVFSPWSFDSGGAHATRPPATTRTKALAASRIFFIGEPSYGRDARRWR
jgi:hypothetical protein